MGNAYDEDTYSVLQPEGPHQFIFTRSSFGFFAKAIRGMCWDRCPHQLRGSTQMRIFFCLQVDILIFQIHCSETSREDLIIRHHAIPELVTGRRKIKCALGHNLISHRSGTHSS